MLCLSFAYENGHNTNSVIVEGLEEAMGVNTSNTSPRILRVLRNVICIWINLQRSEVRAVFCLFS